VLSVLIPELDALLAESSRVPGRLSRLLERGAERSLQEDAFQSQLLTGQALAAAPLTRRLDAVDDAEGIWMRADPVSFQPDLNAVWIQPQARLSPGAALVTELQAMFADFGLRFELPNAERGYLQLDSLPECEFEPPWNLTGVSLEDLMPRGEGAGRWRKLLSECQILMHQHRDRGEDVPGGLWFWGADQLPERRTIAPRVRRIVATDPVLVSLANWLGLPCESNESLESCPGDGALIEWPVRFDRSADENLEKLDAFLKPAWRRLRLGRIEAIEISGRRRAWRTRPRDSWRFWKRRKRAVS